jgi:NADH-quinone oxidoreductase subunit I
LEIVSHQPSREYHALLRFDASAMRRLRSNAREPRAIAYSPFPRILDKTPPAQETENMRELFHRLFQLDFLKGMRLTFRTQHPKNIYTEQYPLERPMVAERYRGAPRLNKNPESGETLCIACNLCTLACPENLIVVGWERDDATRRKVLTTFTYDTSRCMFCGLCEDACPTDALELTQDFEMAYYTREGAIWDRHRLEEGPTPTRYTR